jgi:hypothetical protein
VNLNVSHHHANMLDSATSAKSCAAPSRRSEAACQKTWASNTNGAASSWRSIDGQVTARALPCSRTFCRWTDVSF